MEESPIDKMYAKLWEEVNSKELKEEPTFLKSLRNLACIILIMGFIIIIGVILDYFLKLSPRKDISIPEEYMTIELTQYNGN